jgi:hypothetical protein
MGLPKRHISRPPHWFSECNEPVTISDLTDQHPTRQTNP